MLLAGRLPDDRALRPRAPARRRAVPPPRDAFIIVPQKLSTVLFVMVFWRSLLSVGDELMTRVWNGADAPLGRGARAARAARRLRPARGRDPARDRQRPRLVGARTPSASEPDDARLDAASGPIVELGVGVPRRAAALGRRAGIEQQQAVAVVAHRQVRVAEADDARAREMGAQALAATALGARSRAPARSATPPISSVCSAGRRAATSQPSQLPATPSSGASAPSSSSSAASVTSPVWRMRSASAHAVEQRSRQRPPAPRPEMRVARDDDADLRHAMAQESTRSPAPTRLAVSAPPPPSR